MQRFTLRIIWLDYDIGLAIDHIVEQGYSPLSSYFFWPRNDAWSQIKKELESKPWVSENDKVKLLNDATKIIHYWQHNKSKVNFSEIKREFPDFIFCGN